MKIGFVIMLAEIAGLKRALHFKEILRLAEKAEQAGLAEAVKNLQRGVTLTRAGAGS